MMVEGAAHPSRETEDTSPPVTGATVRRLVSAAATVPAIGAIVLGLAYGLGAVFKLGQLHHAGLHLDDTFSRIPLQEILTEGVGIEVLIGVALPVMGLVIAVSQRIEERFAKRKTPPPISLPSGVTNGFVAVSTVCVFLYAPWTFLITVILIGIALGSYFVVFGRPRTRLEIGATAASGATLGFVLLSFALPHALPRVDVETHSRQKVVGPLITFSDGVWIVGTRRPSGYIAVPSDEISSVTATSSSDFSQRPLYKVLLAVA